MEADTEMLKADEQMDVLEAILVKLEKYVKLPVGFERFDSSKACISLFTQTGAKYLSKNILGGFTAEIPFHIVYRAYPKRDKQKFQMINYISNIAEWLCAKENKLTVVDRNVEKIEQTSNPALNYMGANGAVDYIVSFKIRIRKECEW